MALSTCTVVPAASVVIMLPPDATETYGAPFRTVTTKVALIAEPFKADDYIPPADIK